MFRLLAIAIVLVLAIFFGLREKLPTIHWWDKYLPWMQKMFGIKPGVSGVIQILILPVAILAIIRFIPTSGNPILVALQLLISVLTLLYTLGPTNYKAESSDGKTGPITDLFLEANNNVFGVLTWFALLGPVGALLYKLLLMLNESAATAETYAPIKAGSATVKGVLDWLPIRIIGLLYALAGTFGKTFGYWVLHALSGISQNDDLLTTCGMRGLGYRDVESFNAADPIECRKEAGELIMTVLWLFLSLLIVFLFGGMWFHIIG